MGEGCLRSESAPAPPCEWLAKILLLKLRHHDKRIRKDCIQSLFTVFSTSLVHSHYNFATFNNSMMIANPVTTQVVAQEMHRDVLDKHPSLLVKQTRKGCCMELCLGCDANTEFKISTMDNMHQNVLYASENTSCCIRMFCGSVRPFTITLSEGAERGGPVHSLYERPLAFPLGCFKCCCFQEIDMKTPTGAPLGKVIENNWHFVPSFSVVDANQVVQYSIHQPTCIGGMCVDVFYDGVCNFRIPFHIYEPGRETAGQEVGQVVKVWSGLSKEMFTDADNFELRFPANIDAPTKTRLLGATFLINQLFFEGKE